MDTAQSKKVFVGALAMQMIYGMSDDPKKFPFAVIICVLAMGYMVKQTVLDWFKNKSNKEQGDV